MKKYMSFVLCVCLLLLSLGGCNNSKETSTDNKDSSLAATDLLSRYVSGDNVSNELLTSVDQADDIKAFPHYDKDTLAPDGLQVFVLYEKGAAVSAVVLAENNGVISAVQSSSYSSYVSDINECSQKQPEFEMMGFIDYSLMHSFFGKIKGEETILLYKRGGALSWFQQVESDFSTMEEGARIRSQYISNAEEIKDGIPIFEWTREAIPENGFYRTYGYAEYYDSIIVCPLLNERGEEGTYICHLIYLRNQSVGEVVMNYNGETVWEVWGEYDEDSETYSPLDSLSYVKTVDAFMELYPDTEIKGVKFSEGKYEVLPK